jgi:hypothetical protein
LQQSFWLTSPAEVLRAWQQQYASKSHGRGTFYTLLHGERLEAAVRSALKEVGNGEHAVLSSFSAARWILPYARVSGTHYFYADAQGADVLRRCLALQAFSQGENVVIEEPGDADVFAGRIQAAPGIWCTGLVQTFLDLSSAGERGRDAAEQLLHQKLLALWKEAA